MRYLIILVFCLAVATGAQAQQCPGTSPYWGLNCFLNSEFMLKFEETRARAQQSAHDFKLLAAEEEFSAEDVQRVMDAYNAAANRFNDVLYRIKEDLLDKRKRKFLVRYPDDYALQVEAELNKATNFYDNTYARAVTEVTDGRVQTVAFLTLLPEIIKYFKVGIALFQKVKKEIRKYNDEMIEQHLIQNYRFHSWDEIAGR